MQQWDSTLFEALSKAGGTVYSNYAVGYNNVVVPDANKHGIAVGNTPGELTIAAVAGHLCIVLKECVCSNTVLSLPQGEYPLSKQTSSDMMPVLSWIYNCILSQLHLKLSRCIPCLVFKYKVMVPPSNDSITPNQSASGS